MGIDTPKSTDVYNKSEWVGDFKTFYIYTSDYGCRIGTISETGRKTILIDSKTQTEALELLETYLENIGFTGIVILSDEIAAVMVGVRGYKKGL